MARLVNLDGVVGERDGIVRRMQDNELSISNLMQENQRLATLVAEYDVALHVLNTHCANVLDTVEDANGDESHPYGSQRKQIEGALNTFARDGATVSALRDYIFKRHNVDIAANTISVTLSRLKAKDLARLKGTTWFPCDPWDMPEVEERRADQASEVDDDPPF